jgi:hypothetical protein
MAPEYSSCNLTLCILLDGIGPGLWREKGGPATLAKMPQSDLTIDRTLQSWDFSQTR